jgi:hypothetical protein
LYSSFLKFGAIPGTIFIYFVFSLRDLHYIHPRDGFRLLDIFLAGYKLLRLVKYFILLGRGWGAGRDSNPGLPYSSPAR